MESTRIHINMFYYVQDHLRMLRQQWETELAKIPQLTVDEEMKTHEEQVETELTQINKGSVSMPSIVY